MPVADGDRRDCAPLREYGRCGIGGAGSWTQLLLVRTTAPMYWRSVTVTRGNRIRAIGRHGERGSDANTATLGAFIRRMMASLADTGKFPSRSSALVRVSSRSIPEGRCRPRQKDPRELAERAGCDERTTAESVWPMSQLPDGRKHRVRKEGLSQTSYGCSPRPCRGPAKRTRGSRWPRRSHWPPSSNTG